jgi:glycosyltransferase involved in cell wall biosynthesis
MCAKPIIDVIMVTYNHEKYIAQAIDSVLAQKTDFSFRLIIGDDYSTDETRNICLSYAAQYPTIITCILHEENKGIILNYKSTLESGTAKYIAILEGDDYWTDEHKLQKQFDILEADIETGVVYSKYFILENNNIRLFDYKKIKNRNGHLYPYLLHANFIGPLTACFRRDLISSLDFDFLVTNKITSIDYMLWLELSVHTKFHFLSDATAVYRRHPDSLSNTNDFTRKENFLSSSFIVVDYFLKKYPLDNSRTIKRRSHNKLNLTLMYSAIQSGNFAKVKEYSHRLEPETLKESLISVFVSKLIVMKLIRILKLV